MTTRQSELPAEEGSEVDVWDSTHCPPGQAFSIYRETLQSSPIQRWSAEYRSERPFAFRLESIAAGNGLVSRARLTTHATVRTKADIARSSMEFFCVSQVLSCRLHVDQAGRSNCVQSGDVIVFDGAQPIVIAAEESNRPGRLLTLFIPKDSFPALKEPADYFSNTRIPSDRLLQPLASGFNLMAQRLSSSPKAEMDALYDACVSLLPVAAGCYGERHKEIEVSPANHLHREILRYVNGNIADPALSPTHVGQVFGVSDRYVHKLFARSGITFSVYVMSRRLQHACIDLLSATTRHHPIAAVAHRWGFSDLSAFYRAFKARFGCTPHELRMRSS